MSREISSLLVAYAEDIAATDVLGPQDFTPVLQGLYGEVGGIMATAKKHVREKNAYPGFRRAAEEEFGDTLWYMAAICRRVGAPLDEIFAEASNADGVTSRATSLDVALVRLGKSAAHLLGTAPARTDLVAFARDYSDSLNSSEISLSEVVNANLRKARGAFLMPQDSELAALDFDAGHVLDEQLPRHFKIRVNQRESDKSYLQMNGVFIGDPLTDNIADRDGYRFHDVFHFSYAAILHWSPVMRSLIKQKRKSVRELDEEQDGGRAIVVEEGVSAWIFSKAKELNYFEDQERVSLGILKTIGEFVRGYEVDQCPLKLWEKAILDGYAVFRQLKENKGGWVIGNRELRTISYLPLESAR